jgi:hypothetical protein
MALCLFSNDKKGRRGLMFFQQSQNQRGRDRVRAVIKCQGNHISARASAADDGQKKSYARKKRRSKAAPDKNTQWQYTEPFIDQCQSQ